MKQSIFRNIRRKLLDEGKLVRYLTYAIGEVVLIIVGILFALKINDWNEDRLIRIQESEAVSRIITDLEDDLELLEGRMGNLTLKEASLLRVRNTFSEGNVNEPLLFLEDLLIGTHHGWVQANTSRPTYDDLIGSGKLGIIVNPDLRAQISDYYNTFEMVMDGLALRLTRYPNLTSQYMPKSGLGRKLESGLGEVQVDEIVRLILESPVKDHVTAEINFGRYTHSQSLNIKGRALELIEALKAYQTETQ